MLTGPAGRIRRRAGPGIGECYRLALLAGWIAVTAGIVSAGERDTLIAAAALSSRPTWPSTSRQQTAAGHAMIANLRGEVHSIPWVDAAAQKRLHGHQASAIPIDEAMRVGSTEASASGSRGAARPHRKVGDRPRHQGSGRDGGSGYGVRGAPVVRREGQPGREGRHEAGDIPPASTASGGEHWRPALLHRQHQARLQGRGAGLCRGATKRHQISALAA